MLHLLRLVLQMISTLINCSMFNIQKWRTFYQFHEKFTNFNASFRETKPLTYQVPKEIPSKVLHMPPIVEGAVEPELVEVGLLVEDVEVKCPLEETKTPLATVPAAKNRKRSRVTRNRQLMLPEAEELIVDSALDIFVALEAVFRTINPKAEWVIKR